MKTLYLTIVPFIVMPLVIGMFLIGDLGTNIFVFKMEIYKAVMVAFVRLGIVTACLNAGIFAFIALVTVVQVAISDLRGEAFGSVDCPAIWTRFFLSGFALALAPLAFMAIGFRMGVQKYQGAGFVSDGPVIYILALLFLLMSCTMWYLAAYRTIVR